MLVRVEGLQHRVSSSNRVCVAAHFVLVLERHGSVPSIFSLMFRDKDADREDHLPSRNHAHSVT
jgi:hypothetical protein